MRNIRGEKKNHSAVIIDRLMPPFLGKLTQKLLQTLKNVAVTVFVIGKLCFIVTKKDGFVFLFFCIRFRIEWANFLLDKKDSTPIRQSLLVLILFVENVNHFKFRIFMLKKSN